MARVRRVSRVLEVAGFPVAAEVATSYTVVLRLDCGHTIHRRRAGYRGGVVRCPLCPRHYVRSR